jgi:hypothetical protein
MQPLVSILIPGFNAERWIKQTLESAINQDYRRKEIIFVDDGSTDRTLDIVKTFESRFVRVISQKNAGGPAARNTALSHAQGEFIQWLDADDLLAPDKISNQIKYWQELRNDRILFSCPFETFYYRWTKARLFESRLYGNLTPTDYFSIKFSDDAFFQPACWLVSRRISELAGPWWELRSPDDDGEYFCRTVVASQEIQFVPEARCYWRVGNGRSISGAWRRSQASSQALQSGLRAMFQYITRCIEHFRGLEDSARSRAACIAFLQNRLIYFYLDSPEIVEEMNALAEELGGTLSPPPLSWKYRYIRAAFGWPAAKRCMFALPDIKHQFERGWDKLMFEARSDVASSH